MGYYFNKTLSQVSFEEAKVKTTAALAAEGFGVLTEIDISATMKKKLDVDLPAYTILGACNPGLAYQALQSEEKIGLMLPCNVIVQQKENGVEVSAVDPAASMQAIENAGLEEVATQVRQKLQQVIKSL